MAETREELEAQLARLRDVRARGHKSYTINTADGSRSMEFRDDRELASAIRDIERRIAKLTRPLPSFLKFQVDRGLR